MYLYTKQFNKRIKQFDKKIKELEKRAEEMIKHRNSMVDNFHIDNQTEIPVHENNKWGRNTNI